MFSHAVALPPKHKIKATECGGAHIGDDFRTLWGSVDCPKCLAKRPRHPSISEPTRGRTCAGSAWPYSPPVACAGAVTSTAWWGSLATDPRTSPGSTSRYQRAGKGSADSGHPTTAGAWIGPSLPRRHVGNDFFVRAFESGDRPARPSLRTIRAADQNIS